MPLIMPDDIAPGATSIKSLDAGARRTPRSPPAGRRSCVQRPREESLAGSRAADGVPEGGAAAVPHRRHDGDGTMNAAIAVPGNIASTFLVHLFGTGLEDDRYIVERFKVHADGNIRPWPGEASVKAMRPACTDPSSPREKSTISACESSRKPAVPKGVPLN